MVQQTALGELLVLGVRTAVVGIEIDADAATRSDLVLLRRDTLVLRFADHEQGYYRKQE